MKKEESLQKEISVIAIRIKELIKKYTEEEYTLVPDSIKNQVFAHLIKASTISEKERMSLEILLTNSKYEKNLPKNVEELNLIPYIRAAVSTCKNHYSYEFVEDVKKIIGRIECDSKYHDEKSYFKQAINISTYIKSNNYYYEIKEFMDSVYKLEKISGYRYDSLVSLYGLREILLSFENEIEAIPMIKDKNLKNAVIDYINEFINFENFIEK